MLDGGWCSSLPKGVYIELLQNLKYLPRKCLVLQEGDVAILALQEVDKAVQRKVELTLVSKKR